MQNAGRKALEKARELSRGSAGNNLTPVNDQGPVGPNAHFACELRYPGYPVPQSEQQGREHCQVSGPSGFEFWSGQWEGGRSQAWGGGCGELGRAWEGPV